MSLLFTSQVFPPVGEERGKSLILVKINSPALLGKIKSQEWHLLLVISKSKISHRKAPGRTARFLGIFLLTSAKLETNEKSVCISDSLTERKQKEEKLSLVIPRSFSSVASRVAAFPWDYLALMVEFQRVSKFG